MGPGPARRAADLRACPPLRGQTPGSDPSLPAGSDPVPPAAESPAFYRRRLRDASHFSGSAEAICFPENEAQIAALLREAQRAGRPVTISGGGTGLTGGRVPRGGLLLCTDRLNRILEVEWDGRSPRGRVRLQPGVTLEALEAALAEKGLFYPPNPGEKAAFLGGTVATNASGSRSHKYGPTRSFVERLRIVLPTGELLEIGRGEHRAQGRRLSLERPDGGRLKLRLPGYRMPETKNAAGYFAQDNMDLLDLFVGSEGTLGVVTEMTLTVLPRPEAVLSGLLFFDSEADGFEFAEKAASEFSPRALEFFDARALRMLMTKYPEIPQGAGGGLLFEAECAPSKAESLAERWLARLRRRGAGHFSPWFSRPERPETEELFRRLRYEVPVMANKRAERNGFRKVGTDLAVPALHARAMFDFYFRTLAGCGLDYAVWGHLADHHLHVNLFPNSEAAFRKAQALYGSFVDEALRFKGTVSAEHGIGKTRIVYLERMVGRRGLREMAALKKGFDPAGILNPGNLFPAELLGKRRSRRSNPGSAGA